MKKITLLALLFMYVGVSQTNQGPQYFINEVDADQDGTDTLEFIELKTNPPNTSLDGMVLVLFNGNHATNGSYNVIDLHGFTTDNNGFLIIGDDAVPGVDIAIGASNKLQNGPDAVALYFGVPADFPNGTPPTTTNLVAAIVYAKGEPDDVDLLQALAETTQYNEDLNGNSEQDSLQRTEDGSFCTAPNTLDLNNSCAICNFVITATNSTCDANTSGVDTTTVFFDFEGGGTEAFNITLVTGTGTIGGDDPTSSTTGTIIIAEVEENTIITLNISSATCNIDTNVTTSMCEPAEEVATIADLRASTIGETYTLTGEVVLTFQQEFRNQKFIEDPTAAILIDDPEGVISTNYAIKSGITGITGVLAELNAQMIFLPESDPGPPSSPFISMLPQAVSITQLNTTPEAFESEFVQLVQGVAIDNTSHTTWIANNVYEMINPNGSFHFKTSFLEVDYLGLKVPLNNVNIAGIITNENGNYYLTSRNLNDVNGIVLHAPETVKNTFKIYPNPANQDYITIISAHSSIMDVFVYDTTGKLVVTNTTNGKIKVSALSSGLYLLKITQGNLVVTEKLVVR